MNLWLFYMLDGNCLSNRHGTCLQGTINCSVLCGSFLLLLGNSPVGSGMFSLQPTVNLILHFSWAGLVYQGFFLKYIYICTHTQNTDIFVQKNYSAALPVYVLICSVIQMLTDLCLVF